MKFDVIRAIFLLIWIAGSLHTAAVTGGLVMVNRHVSPSSKTRYVLFGGPAVWLVFLCVLMAATVMGMIYRWKNRHVEKGSKG